MVGLKKVLHGELDVKSFLPPGRLNQPASVYKSKTQQSVPHQRQKSLNYFVFPSTHHHVSWVNKHSKDLVSEAPRGGKLKSFFFYYLTSLKVYKSRKNSLCSLIFMSCLTISTSFCSVLLSPLPDILFP